MERQVTLEEIVNVGLEQLRNSIYVCVPGSVVSYNAQTLTADVQPMVNDVRFNLDTGAIVYEPWSIIHAVPVCWPRFGGFTIAGFLQQYDPVVLEAFDLDPSAWRAQGRSNKPVNPTDVRRLGGNYWRCVPTDLTGPIASAPTSAGMVIGADGKPQQIVLTPSGLTIGKSGAQVALSGGGAAVGRVGDAITITPAQVIAAALIANLSTGAVTATNSLQGTISAGSPNVTSG